MDIVLTFIIFFHPQTACQGDDSDETEDEEQQVGLPFCTLVIVMKVKVHIHIFAHPNSLYIITNINNFIPINGTASILPATL